MCYGGCDCARCAGEPPVIKKSDRQQCSDDWKELTSKKPIVIFDKKYEGVESIIDLDREVCEAMDAEDILGEFQGTVHVTIIYTPAKGELK